jgi:ribosomal protein L19
MNILRQLEIEHMKPTIPDFGIGDSVDVHYLIKEGDKERVQLFSGTVIAFHGSGTRRNCTVRRLVAGEGVERTFPLLLPARARGQGDAPRPEPRQAQGPAFDPPEEGCDQDRRQEGLIVPLPAAFAAPVAAAAGR